MRFRSNMRTILLFGLLMLAFASLALAQAAQDALTPLRYPQPDGGGISLPAHWVVGELAAPAIETEDGGLFQRLVSARGAYEGTIVVLRVWRMTPASAADELARSIQEMAAAQGLAPVDLPPPRFDAPIGFRGANRMFECAIAGNRTRSRVIACSNEHVSYALSLSWDASAEPAAEADLRAILASWTLSSQLLSRDAIPLAIEAPRTVRFTSGGEASVPPGWQLVAQELASGRVQLGAVAVGIQKLLSLRRYPASPSPTELLVLQRLGGTQVDVASAEQVSRQELSDFAGTDNRDVLLNRYETSQSAIELMSSRLRNGLHMCVRCESLGGVVYTATAWTADPVDGMGSARALLASVRGVPITSIAPDRTEQPISEPPGPSSVLPLFKLPSSGPRIGRELGGATGAFVIFSLPALIGCLWSRRRAWFAFAFTTFVLGWFMALSATVDAASQIQRERSWMYGRDAPEAQVFAQLNEGVDVYTFIAESFGETILPSNTDSLSVITCRLALKEPGAGQRWLLAIAVGLLFAIVGPMLLRFAVIKKPLSCRRYALLAGLGWLCFGLVVLLSLGSSSFPHRALVIGSTLLTLLLLPAPGRKDRGRPPDGVRASPSPLVP
jgi:hypothetical protein